MTVLHFTDVRMPGSRDGFAPGQADPGPGDTLDGARFVGEPFAV